MWYRRDTRTVSIYYLFVRWRYFWAEPSASPCESERRRLGRLPGKQHCAAQHGAVECPFPMLISIALNDDWGKVEGDVFQLEDSLQHNGDTQAALERNEGSFGQAVAPIAGFRIPRAREGGSIKRHSPMKLNRAPSMPPSGQVAWLACPLGLLRRLDDDKPWQGCARQSLRPDESYRVLPTTGSSVLQER